MTSDTNNSKYLKTKIRHLLYKIGLITLFSLALNKNAKAQDVLPQNDKKDFPKEASVLNKVEDFMPSTLNMRYLFMTSDEANAIMDQLADSSFIAYVKRYDNVSKRLISQILKKNGSSYDSRVTNALSMEQDSTWLARPTGVPVGMHCVYGCYSTCVKAQGDSIMRNVLSRWQSNIVNSSYGVIQELAQPLRGTPGGGIFRIRSEKDVLKNSYEYDVIIGNTGDPHCISLVREKDAITLRAYNGEHLDGFWQCTQAVSLHNCYTQEYSKVKDSYQDINPGLRLIYFIENHLTNEKGKLLVNTVTINGEKVSVDKLLEDLKFCNEFIDMVTLKFPDFQDMIKNDLPDENLLAGAVSKFNISNVENMISNYFKNNKNGAKIQNMQIQDYNPKDKRHKQDESPKKDAIPTQFASNNTRARGGRSGRC